ncbi:unnamed protein product [Ixodes pacificus]
MADDAGDASDISSLNEHFDKGFREFSIIERSSESANNKTYQDQVAEATKHLECATHLVNQCSLFSGNEEIDEVATAHLKFLLLPALLGSLSQKCVGGDRSEILRLSEVYFRDFLHRCRQYGLTSHETAEAKEDDGTGDDASTKTRNSGKESTENLLAACRRRQEKIQRFEQQKAMEERQTQLRELLQSPNVDDELVREYYLVLLRYWVNNAIEELRSIEEEKPILQYMAQVKAEGAQSRRAPVPQRSQPLRPIIITKNELQKQVYGVGYPSIPSMTVDEFYAKRYPEHARQEGAGNAVKPWSLQDWAADPEKASRELEEEDAQKEKLLEEDDKDALTYLRSMDDWKDENKRGSGNRKNMG